MRDRELRRIIIAGCVIAAFFVFAWNYSVTAGVIRNVISVLSPFILGCCIAFVINVPMSRIEKHLFSKKTGEKWQGRRRGIALILTFLITFTVIGIVIGVVVPQLSATVKQIVASIPEAMEKLEAWVKERFADQTVLAEIVESVTATWQKLMDDLVDIIKDLSGKVLKSGISAFSGIISGVTSFFIGLVFSIYILLQKEKLGRQAKMLAYAYLKEPVADRLCEIAALSHKTFSSFISGQCLEACILGMMFLVVMLILQMPYAVLISVLIAVMALIPIVGAFIGCGVGVLLILMESPVKALIFLGVFLVLQQIEGNLIYPHVVGSSVGLPGIWVLAAVTVGGSLFGVVGMLVFIPLVSVVYILLREDVYKSLRYRGADLTDAEDITENMAESDE